MTTRAVARERKFVLIGACLLLFGFTVAPLRGQPTPAHEAACLQEGVLAEKLALARDRGVTMSEAVDAVLFEHSDATRELVAAHATLLFGRFRRLPPEQAAFEFQLACMDETQ